MAMFTFPESDYAFGIFKFFLHDIKTTIAKHIHNLLYNLGHGPFSHLFDQIFYKEPSIVEDGKIPSNWKVSI